MLATGLCKPKQSMNPAAGPWQWYGEFTAFKTPQVCTSQNYQVHERAKERRDLLKEEQVLPGRVPCLVQALSTGRSVIKFLFQGNLLKRVRCLRLAQGKGTR